MIENLEENRGKKIDCGEKYVSVTIECGNKHLCINGVFLGENREHFIVKEGENKVVYICRNRIISRIFEESKSSFGYY